MILTGDVAIADGDYFSFNNFPKHLHDFPMCINLEGAIKPANAELVSGVYNSENLLESFSGFNLTHPFVANNHIHDLDDGVVKTQRYFGKENLQLVGAGTDLQDASKPVLVDSGGFRYAIFGYGWPVIGCVPSKLGKPGVNPFNRDDVLLQVAEFSKKSKGVRIVVVVHGNYEFEPYPQPGHRKLALELIDLGVYSVIFHHPHIVGPIERYKERTIAYSLGNWAFSYGHFFDKRLTFPSLSYHQVAIELGHEDTVHHANFEPPNHVNYDKSEPVLSVNLSLKAEFEGFNDAQYLKWFKENRHKNKLLPIYTSADKSVENFIKDTFVYIRQLGIHAAVRVGLKTLRRK